MHRATDRLLLLDTFLKVCERGSVSRAADDLGMSQARASKLLKELEEQLQVQLVLRNTRQLSITEAGEAFAQDALVLLNAWDSLVEKHSANSSIKKYLKIVLPSDLGQYSLPDIVASHITASHEKLQLRWLISDDEISFFGSGCDLWIRIGKVNDERLIVTTVGYVQSVVVISPLYPNSEDITSPSELAKIDAVGPVLHYDEEVRLKSSGSEDVVFIPTFSVMSASTADAHRATCHALGYSVLPLPWVAEDIAQGRLRRLLPDWGTEPEPINLVRAPNRYRSNSLGGLVESLRQGVQDIVGVSQS